MGYVDHLTVTLRKGRTVPRAMLMHVGWIDAFLGEEQPWPVQHPQLARRVTAHHKQNSKGKPSNGFLHSPSQVKVMANAICTLTDPSTAPCYDWRSSKSSGIFERTMPDGYIQSQSNSNMADVH